MSDKEMFRCIKQAEDGMLNLLETQYDSLADFADCGPDEYTPIKAFMCFALCKFHGLKALTEEV